MPDWDRILHPGSEFFDTELWSRLEPKVRQEINECVEKIAAGRAADFETYRHQTGFLHGLRWVMDMARELTKGNE